MKKQIFLSCYLLAITFIYLSVLLLLFTYFVFSSFIDWVIYLLFVITLFTYLFVFNVAIYTPLCILVQETYLSIYFMFSRFLFISVIYWENYLIFAT
mgnify:CR=1 FL=1